MPTETGKRRVIKSPEALAVLEPKALLEALRDAVLIINTRGEIVMANSQAECLFAYKDGALTGKEVEVLVPQSDATVDIQLRKEDFETPTILSTIAPLNMQARRRDGSTFPVEISLSPVDTGQGKMACAVIRDVTDQKQASDLLEQRAQQYSQLNQQLEARVAKRTAKLEATMEELEAFAYSVSHDLRAPLRAIDGFSRILLTDQSEQLDSTGREHLDRIRAATMRMGTLIDQLLTLSRISRRPLKRKRVDLSEMASAIINELEADQPERQVEWKIQPNLIAQADPGLMRSVLYNLLGNAWKFTATTDNPYIEFGCNMDDGPQFFVRDNGVGFDMAYASKLFGAFQRLHSASDFPGTGIGLATVKRIINRHNGTIYAQAAEGKGATLYFTLGPVEESDDG